ncbi:MAG TPA: hypothetical protein VGH19_09480 [Verrucomicrobiae bacterium]
MSEPTEPIKPQPEGCGPAIPPVIEPAAPAKGKGSAELPWPHVVFLVVVIILSITILPKYLDPQAGAAKASCSANLKQIDGAVKQWALDNHKLGTDTVEMKDVLKYIKGGELPKCPEDGTYSLGLTIADAPLCSMGLKAVPGHTLP